MRGLSWRPMLAALLMVAGALALAPATSEAASGSASPLLPPENTLARCTDGRDNDRDGLVDAADPDCDDVLSGGGGDPGGSLSSLTMLGDTASDGDLGANISSKDAEKLIFKSAKRQTVVFDFTANAIGSDCRSWLESDHVDNRGRTTAAPDPDKDGVITVEVSGTVVLAGGATWEALDVTSTNAADATIKLNPDVGRGETWWVFRFNPIKNNGDPNLSTYAKVWGNGTDGFTIAPNASGTGTVSIHNNFDQINDLTACTVTFQWDAR